MVQFARHFAELDAVPFHLNEFLQLLGRVALVRGENALDRKKGRKERLEKKLRPQMCARNGFSVVVLADPFGDGTEDDDFVGREAVH